MAPMTTVSRVMRASPETVFVQLADGWIFAAWVVGASHIRDVDDHWPAVGSELHHKIGAWPAMINDATRVVEVTPNKKLVLQARAQLFGQARVELTLEPSAEGCVVTMAEAPTRGPAQWIDNPAQRFVLRRRNIESLARLATLAEKRVSGTAPRPDQGPSR